MYPNYRLKSIVVSNIAFLLILIIVGGLSFTKNVSAQSVMSSFDFEDGTLQGWKFTQRDKQGVSDIGTNYYGCRNAYPVEVSFNEGKSNSRGVKIGPERESDAYVCRAGISKSFTVSPNSDIIISFDARTKSDSSGSTVSNIVLFVYGGSKIPEDFRERGLPYYNHYTRYENPTERKMLFPPRYDEGGYDSGWDTYNIRVNSKQYSKVTIFLATRDAWMTDWDKELYIDNVKVIYVDALYSVISRMREIVGRLNELLIQYRSIRL